VPFLTFFAAVLIVAWYSGVGPAILTLILSVLGVIYWFIPPVDSLKIFDSTYGYGVIVFVLLSALVIVFSMLIARQGQGWRQRVMNCGGHEIYWSNVFRSARKPFGR
jgi:K+-sensing histidine kinase KdpD